MQFRAVSVFQVKRQRPAKRPSPSDRGCPLDTAGDRCLWHAGGTAGEHDSRLSFAWQRRFQLAVGESVLGDDFLVDKPHLERLGRAGLGVMRRLEGRVGSCLAMYLVFDQSRPVPDGSQRGSREPPRGARRSPAAEVEWRELVVKLDTKPTSGDG